MMLPAINCLQDGDWDWDRWGYSRKVHAAKRRPDAGKGKAFGRRASDRRLHSGQGPLARGALRLGKRVGFGSEWPCPVPVKRVVSFFCDLSAMAKGMMVPGQPSGYFFGLRLQQSQRPVATDGWLFSDVMDSEERVSSDRH